MSRQSNHGRSAWESEMRRTHERIKQLEVEAEPLVHPQHSLAVKEEVQQSVRGFAATDPWRGEQVRRGGEPGACAGRRGCAADSSCGCRLPKLDPEAGPWASGVRAMDNVPRPSSVGRPARGAPNPY